MRGQRLAHGAAVGHRRGAKAVAGEVVGEQFADVAVVIDDQQVIECVHG